MASSPLKPVTATHRAIAHLPYAFHWFPLACGLFFGLALLKLGNPVTLDHVSPPPTSLNAAIFETWPFYWGVALFGGLVIWGFFCDCTIRRRHTALFFLPIAWFGWNLVSATQTTDWALTGPTLLHFLGCLLANLLGIKLFRRFPEQRVVWFGLAIGLSFILLGGARQHYGGLASDEAYFVENQKRGWTEVPSRQIETFLRSGILHVDANNELQLQEGLIAKMRKRRVFSTFVYPNAFAGAIILVFPVAVWWLVRASASWPNVLRGVVLGFFGYLAFANLFWTGSRSGFLVAMILLAVSIASTIKSRWTRTMGLIIGLIVGGSLFAFQFQDYFARGARSLGARFDYWNAAVSVAKQEPILGSGPGTFYLRYRAIKPPGAEMARLAHNDYLQQASDAGWPAFLFYAGFVVGSIILLRPRLNDRRGAFAVWLGLLGWSIQGVSEFNLYLPASAWLAFFLFGWLHEATGPDAFHLAAGINSTSSRPPSSL